MNFTKQGLIVDLSANKHKVNPTIAVHQGEVTLLLGWDNKVSDPLCSVYFLNIDLATEAVDNESHGFTLHVEDFRCDGAVYSGCLV